MEFPLRSAQIRSALDQGKSLLAGKTAVACMGDLLTLASFSLVPVISDSLKVAALLQTPLIRSSKAALNSRKKRTHLAQGIKRAQAEVLGLP